MKNKYLVLMFTPKNCADNSWRRNQACASPDTGMINVSLPWCKTTELTFRRKTNVRIMVHCTPRWGR